MRFCIPIPEGPTSLLGASGDPLEHLYDDSKLLSLASISRSVSVRACMDIRAKSIHL